MIEQGWFQQQLNEEAKRLGKSSTDRLVIEIPSIHPQMLKHLYEEVSIQMAANVISNRMLEYFTSQITAMIMWTEGHHESAHMGLMKHPVSEDVPFKNLFDPETKTIKLSKIYEDNEDEVINSIIMFLKIELQSMMERMAAFNAQRNRVQPASGIHMP